MKKAEEEIQKAIVEKYLEYQARFPFFTFLYSNRNENNQGGIKGIIKGRIYKEMGRVAGIPDLTLLYGKGKIAFFEVKTPKACLKKDGTFIKSKGLSDEQINIHNMLTINGFIVEVVYSVKSFEQFLCKIILREKSL
jgi:hypothetical protein